MTNKPKRQTILTVLLLCWMLPLFSAVSGNAEHPPQILLLNSDASVKKYREPQEAFKETIKGAVQEINLGSKKWKLPEVEEFFYDETPDLIYCIGTKAYLIANRYAPTTPRVFSSIINWLRLPVTDQTYGISNELHTGMEMMLFRYIFPDIQKIGIIYSQQYTAEWIRMIHQDARAVGLEIVGMNVSDRQAVQATLETLVRQIDAFWLIPDPALLSEKQDLLEILALCDAARVPVFSYHEAFARCGAVLTISVDAPTIGRQAAGIAAEILAGEQLEHKVQFPAGTYIVLNLKKAAQYGLSYNDETLNAVNFIIE